MRFATTLCAGIGAFIIVACGGGGGGDSTGPGPSAAAVAKSAGDSQSGALSVALTDSLAVLVTDTGGHPVSGITVTWAVTGGGSVHPTSSVTGATGIARAQRVLGGTAGAAGTSATVASLTPVLFTSIGTVNGAVTIANHAVGPFTDTVLGTLVAPESLPAVLITDIHGQPVAGISVTWSATGGGAVTSTSVPTDANGISKVGYTFSGTAGTGFGANATVTGLVNSPIHFSLSATAGAPTALLKAAGDTILAAPGAVVGQSVKLVDGHNNGVSGVTIDWTTGGGGSVNPTSSVTGATGFASTSRTLGASTGNQSTVAKATALAGPPTVTFNVTAAHLVKVANNSFNPNSATITIGDSIAWQWQGVTAAHNITFDAISGAPTNEGDRTTGLVFRVFSKGGDYTYQCTNHPGMTGTIHVTP